KRLSKIIAPWYSAYLEKSPTQKTEHKEAAKKEKIVPLTTLEAMRMTGSRGELLDLLESILADLAELENTLDNAERLTPGKSGAPIEMKPSDKKFASKMLQDAERSKENIEKAVSTIDRKTLSKSLQESEKQFRKLLQSDVSEVQLSKNSSEKPSAAILPVVEQLLDVSLAVVGFGEVLFDLKKSRLLLYDYKAWLTHELVLYSRLTNELRDIEIIEKTYKLKKERTSQHHKIYLDKSKEVGERLLAYSGEYPSDQDLEEFNKFIFPKESNHKTKRSIMALLEALEKQVKKDQLNVKSFSELMESKNLESLEDEIFSGDKLKKIEKLPLSAYRIKLQESLNAFLGNTKRDDVKALSESQMVQIILELEKMHVEKMRKNSQEVIVARHKLYVQQEKRNKNDTNLNETEAIVDRFVPIDTPLYNELKAPFVPSWSLATSEVVSCQEISQRAVNKLQKKHNHNWTTFKSRGYALLGVTLAAVGGCIVLACPLTLPVIGVLALLAVATAAALLVANIVKRNATKEIKHCILNLPARISEGGMFSDSKKKAEKEAKHKLSASKQLSKEATSNPSESEEDAKKLDPRFAGPRQ
ncbi:MAG TPA: hypothetical protein VHZ76_02560, partial [Gammaproteobacteria bacterium]|nr:hypothetical protein [Gammaproteobacteria bacterium]